MAIDFNISPYFDDYDESKLFQRILFKPGYAVQARELTQLQTILQNQVTRLGNHMFSDGDMVIPGGVHYDNKYHYVKVDASYTDAASTTFDAETYTSAQLIGATIAGSTSTVAGVVVGFTTSVGSDPVTLFVKYNSSGSIGTSKTFANGEELSTSLNGVTLKFKSNAATSTGTGSAVSVEQGVYFVRGQFALVQSSTVILEKYSASASNKVGFAVTESAVTATNDTTLNDNASGGYSNYNAPGADRYKLELTLAKHAETAVIASDFVELMVIRGGKVAKVKERTTFSLINDAIAVKTRDEAGDYTVRPYITTAADHASDTTKFTLKIAPGKAVVDGYTHEMTDTFSVDVSKPRTVAHNDDIATSVRYGNYVPITITSGVFPDMRFLPEVNLRDGATKIGTCRLRNIEHVSGTGAATVYNAYIFDVKMDTDQSFRNVTKITVGTTTFIATLTAADGASTILGISDNKSVYTIPYARIKDTLNVGSTATATTVTYMNYQELIPANATHVDISVVDGSVETFESILPSDYIVIPINAGSSAFGVPQVVTPTYVTGKTTVRLTVAGRSGDTLAVWSKITKVGSIPKTKTLTENYAEAMSWVSGQRGYKLHRADGWKLKSVVTDAAAGSVDITHQFQFDGGQRDNFYDVSYINMKSNFTPLTTGTFVVTYDHFTHSVAGNYFTIDSYPANISYDEIANHKWNGVDLRDQFDFRSRIGNSGVSYSATGAIRCEVPAVGSSILHNAHYYLPRTDSLFIDNAGNFGITTGANESSATTPEVPGNAMKIYDIVMPGYVKNSTDLALRHIDNKRFTMQDIGEIEDRVDRLEYYTSLTNLEQATLNSNIVTSTNVQRWKSGFMVDSFMDHSKSDNATADNEMAIDPQNGELRPSFNEKNVRLIMDTGTSAGVVKKGDVVMLPYSSTELINQPYASSPITLNAHSKYNWEGNMSLSPASDEWNDREGTPESVSSNVEILPTFNSHNWNNWQWNWAGTRKTTGSNRINRITQSRALVDSISVSVNNDKISIAAIQTIRSRTVFFKVVGLKPSTRFYGFFDGTDVSSWVREEATYTLMSDTTTQYSNHYGSATTHPSGSSALVSDANGEIIGSFFIPNTSAISFKTGDRKFTLSDDSANNATLITSQASFTYKAAGNLLNPIRSTRPGRNINDNGQLPIAQIFNVESPEGVFITKVDLFFKTKTAGKSPIVMQIRSVNLGVPTSKMIPFAEVTVLPADVLVSANAASSTLFEFATPVYLEGGKDYAIALISDSSDYEIWTAGVNEVNLGTTYKVHKQVTAGSLYNDGTEKDHDFKFKLYKAAFNTSQAGSLILNNAILPTRLLTTNPISTVNGTAELHVYHKNHGFHNGSKVTISGVAADIGGIAYGVINGTHTVTEAETDVYRMDSSSNATITAATSTAVGGGSTTHATENSAFNTLYPYIEDMVLSDTSLAWSHKLTTGKSLGGTETPYSLASAYTGFTPNVNHNFGSSMLVATADNETTHMSGAKSTVIRATLNTTNANLSPIIDLDRASLYAIGNRINNPRDGAGVAVTGQNIVEPFVAETLSNNTSSKSKWISKPVSLLNSSTGLNVRMDVNRPEGSYVEVYYRAVRDGEEIDINDRAWVAMTAPSVINTDNDYDTFREYEFVADTLEPFSNFSIKIVFKSDNTSAVPRARDFRVVALGT